MNILTEVLTFAEATGILGKSPSYLNNLVKTGKLIKDKDYREAGRVKLVKRSVVEQLKGVV